MKLEANWRFGVILETEAAFQPPLSSCSGTFGACKNQIIEVKGLRRQKNRRDTKIALAVSFTWQSHSEVPHGQPHLHHPNRRTPRGGTSEAGSLAWTLRVRHTRTRQAWLRVKVSRPACLASRTANYLVARFVLDTSIRGVCLWPMPFSSHPEALSKCSDWELWSKDLSTLGASNRESGFPKLDARGGFGDLPLLKDRPPLPANSPGNTHTHTHGPPPPPRYLPFGCCLSVL